MIPSTVARVPQHTAQQVNEEIRRPTEARVARCAAAGREAIDRRLAELDHEWDIERTLEANAATLATTCQPRMAATKRAPGNLWKP